MTFHDPRFHIEALRISERAAWAEAALAEALLARTDDADPEAGDRREAFRARHCEWTERADRLAEVEEEMFPFPEDWD